MHPVSLLLTLHLALRLYISGRAYHMAKIFSAFPIKLLIFSIVCKVKQMYFTSQCEQVIQAKVSD